MAIPQNHLGLPYPPESFVDFSKLGDPIDSYITGREKGRELRQRAARDALFHDGVPRDEQGGFDYREIAARLAGIGDLQGLKDFAALADRGAMRAAGPPGAPRFAEPTDATGSILPQRGPIGTPPADYPQQAFDRAKATGVGRDVDKAPAAFGQNLGRPMTPHAAYEALHIPRTPQAYAALPRGAYYIHPADGSLRQKG